MVKKVLFMVIKMNIGGTEKALLNMLEEMPKDKYEVTVLLLERLGGFLNYIPKWVKVESLSDYKKIKGSIQNPPLKTTWNFLKRGRVLQGTNFAFYYLLAKLQKDKRIFLKYLLKDTPMLKEKYDIAVAYAGPMDFISFFVAEKVQANKKIQWIHFDVSKIGFDPNVATKMYQKFDKIYTVSKEGKAKFISMVPSLEEKVDVFPNIVSRELVLKQAEKELGFDDDFDGIRVLTVGRLSKEKGQDLVIPVLAKLRHEGINVRWYCIGEGKARKEYEELIKKHGVEQNFVLFGAKPNPYPYMRQCDVYVQPSRHEGYCITLTEAKCFIKPIITTDFTGAKEQLTNYEDGIVLASKSELYTELKKMIDEDKFGKQTLRII